MVERGSGNAFADVGFDNADKMLAKAGLAVAIKDAIKARQYKAENYLNPVGFALRATEGLEDDAFRLSRLTARADALATLMLRSQRPIGKKDDDPLDSG